MRKGRSYAVWIFEGLVTECPTGGEHGVHKWFVDGRKRRVARREFWRICREMAQEEEDGVLKSYSGYYVMIGTVERAAGTVDGPILEISKNSTKVVTVEEDHGGLEEVAPWDWCVFTEWVD